jgi:acetolactate synthase-1/2/3 large subunit
MRSPLPETRYGLVREGVLMEILQRRVVEDSDALVLSDGGSASVLCNHHLKFTEARRYRMTSYFGARGHYAAGVVGAALGRGGKAISILSEEAMLMSAEVSSAVQYKAAAVWIVLNRAGHSENERCHQSLGLNTASLNFPSVDYATLAESLGARGLRVQSESQLDEAIREALASEGPIVLDVWLDVPLTTGLKLVEPVAEVADILGF